MDKETGLRWIRRQTSDGKGDKLEMEKETGLRWIRRQA